MVCGRLLGNGGRSWTGYAASQCLMSERLGSQMADDGKTYAFEGIWFNGAKNANNTQVFVNGALAPERCP